MLATIPADTVLDTYGQGGVVADLEAEICRLLGKPAAAFLPSGVMAQQAVLRVHADARQRRTVIFHPMCHLEQHEEQAYQRLHGLTGRPAGGRDRLITLDDLTAIAEPPAVLLLELPQRDIGGQQPHWDDLVAQVGLGPGARRGRAPGRRAAVGVRRRIRPRRRPRSRRCSTPCTCRSTRASARWRAAAWPGRPDVIEQVREWRRRMGGTLYGLWPSAASALSCLAERLPRFPAYLDHARAIAAALADVPGVTVIPDPPQVPMMHLLLRTSQDDYASAATRLAEERGIWTPPRVMATADPGVQRLELSVGDATLGFEPAELAAIFAGLTGS